MPTAGDDLLTFGPETRGTFDALAGNDTISVSAATGGTVEDITPLQFAWNTDSTDAPLSVQGGAGDDSITVTGNGVEVNGGEGADIIRVDGLRNAVIHGGDMDTIQGQDAESPPLSTDDLDVIYNLTGSATFEGGRSDEVVATTGTGAVVNAGGGDDFLRDFGGSVTLSGGGGNDTLQADISESAFLPSATDELGYYLGNDTDVVFGGAGDDQLKPDKVDFATSNLRGAWCPLYVSGAMVLDVLSMGPVAGTACNATAMSYNGTFSIGLFIDPVAIDSPGDFRDAVEESFEDIVGL